MLDNAKLREYIQRLMQSRIRILQNHGFYGLLLMHVIFSIDKNCESAATDGKRIFFGTDFLENITDNELDFVLMHEILHIALMHILRGEQLENERFNLACDIVVNSNIMLENGNSKPIVLKNFGEMMHLAPNGKEGHLYTAEEVYDMLLPNKRKKSNLAKNGKATIDDHTKWGSADEKSEVLQGVWMQNIMSAAESITALNKNVLNGCGNLPEFAKRIVDSIKKPQIDWRTILNDFVQEEINDYSFSPPDKRFDDSPFYLPDFNETDEYIRNILFMIDTSGSMSDYAIKAAFSEIYGAIEQYGGKLAGKLGFFDAAVIPPIPFEDVHELKRIKPIGGGGTNFRIIFDYVSNNMNDDPPVSIIILTDGYAPFPEEHLANGIPVLWLLNNDEVQPPWGKNAKIKL